MNFRDTLTVEQRKIYRHCLYEATKYFNVQKGYVLHHKDITMRETNLERYIQWLPEDLVVMSKVEHIKLHHTGSKRSEETRKKMSEADKGKTKYTDERLYKQGRTYSENVRSGKTILYWKGRKLSEEHKKHIGEAIKGRKGSQHWLGKHHSEETKQKMRDAWVIRRARRDNKCI